MAAELETPAQLRQKVSLVFVDDSTTMGQIIKNLLINLGFNKDQLKGITGKTSGQDTLVYLESLIGIEDSLSYKIPNVIFLDWNMDVPGIDILKTIRAYAPRDRRVGEILVVMVTAEAMKENIIAAVQAGVSSYIIKPPSPAQIEKKLEDVSKIQLGLAKKLAKELDANVAKKLLSDKDKKKAALNVLAKANSSIALDLKNIAAQKFRKEFFAAHKSFFVKMAGQDVIEGEQKAEDGKYKSAAGTFIDAIKLNPSDPMAHIGLAKMYMKNTDYAKAIDSFKTSLEHLPDNPEALELLGESQLKLADATDDRELYDEAIKSLQSASSLHDADIAKAKSLRDLGKAHAAKGDNEKAASCYQDSLKIESEQIATQMVLATALKKAGKIEEAEKAIEKAASLTPKDPQGLADIGKVWLEKEDKAKGMHYFKLALNHEKASKEDIELYEDVIKSLLNAGMVTESAGLVNVISSDRPDLYNTLGLAYVKHNEFQKAIPAYTKALEKDITGERYAYLHNRGMAYEKSGQTEKAKNDFIEAYSSNPNPATASMLKSLGIDPAKLKPFE